MKIFTEKFGGVKNIHYLCITKQFNNHFSKVIMTRKELIDAYEGGNNGKLKNWFCIAFSQVELEDASLMSVLEVLDSKDRSIESCIWLLDIHSKVLHYRSAVLPKPITRYNPGGSLF